MINTEPENAGLIVSHIAQELMDRTTILPIPVASDKQNDVSRYMPGLVKKHITEDYTLHVDSDELLVLPHSYPTVKSFIASRDSKVDRFVFCWMMVPCDRLFTGSMTKKMHDTATVLRKASAGRKTMGRTKQISHMTHHDMTCGKKVDEFLRLGLEDDPIVLHFLVRSRTHTLLKAMHQKIDSKCTKGSPADVRRFVNLALRAKPGRAPPLTCYPARALIHMHEVAYGKKANVWNAEFVARRVPQSSYAADEDELRRSFIRTLTDIGVLAQDVSKALERLASVAMDCETIADYTKGAYASPRNCLRQKFNRVLSAPPPSDK